MQMQGVICKLQLLYKKPNIKVVLLNTIYMLTCTRYILNITLDSSQTIILMHIVIK